MKLWIKSYTEKVDDPKFCSLTWEQRGIFDALCDLAGIYDHRDENQKETGRLDSLENVAFRLRCTEDVLSSALDAFRSHKMIHIKKGILYVTHYGKRQERPESSKKEAVLERVRRHRKKNVTGSNDVTPSLPNDVTSLEENRVEENREDKRGAGADAPPAQGDSAENAEQEKTRTKPDDSLLVSQTEGGLVLLQRYEQLAATKGRKSRLKHYANDHQRKAFEAVFSKLNGELGSLIDKGFAHNRLSVDHMLSWLEGCVNRAKTPQPIPASRPGRQSNADYERRWAERAKARQKGAA